MCFHSTSVGVDHVSEQFTGDLQGSGSTERCVEGGQGSSTSEALITPNGAIPASERTLQTPPYRAPRHSSLYHLSIQIIFPLCHHHLLFRCFPSLLSHCHTGRRCSPLLINRCRNPFFYPGLITRSEWKLLYFRPQIGMKNGTRDGL